MSEEPNKVVLSTDQLFEALLSYNAARTKEPDDTAPTTKALKAISIAIALAYFRNPNALNTPASSHGGATPFCAAIINGDPMLYALAFRHGGKPDGDGLLKLPDSEAHLTPVDVARHYGKAALAAAIPFFEEEEEARARLSPCERWLGRFYGKNARPLTPQP